MWAFPLIFGGLFILSTALAAVRNAGRRRDMEAAAQSLGFTFSRWAGPTTVPKVATPFLMTGCAGYKNVMTGSYGGLEVEVFDYSRTTGSARNTSSTSQTVAIYKKDVRLPAFSLGPGGLAAKLIDALEHQNVPIADPEFKRHYSLRAPDQEKVRALFTDGLITSLNNLDPSKHWQVEGVGNSLVLYRYARREKPTDLRDFLQETSSIAQSFFAYAGKHDAFAASL
jgi:hypothetical protein